MVNIDLKQERSVNIDVSGLGIKKISGTVLKSDKVQNHNTFDHPNNLEPVEFDNFKLKKGQLEIKLAPYSVVVLKGK